MFWWLSLKEGSTRNNTWVGAHGDEIEGEHYCYRYVEDDDEGWGWVPVLFCYEDGEGDEEDQGAGDYTGHAMPLSSGSSNTAVAEETYSGRPSLM